MEICYLAGNKKNADRIGATIVFIDESGFLPTPSIKATWAPKGSTPKLTITLGDWKKVSSIAGVIVSPGRKHLRLRLSLHQGTNIKADHVRRFLLTKILRAVPHGPIVVLWDRSRAHKGKVVSAFVQKHPRLHLEDFPAYAPELNPVEYVWSYCKRAMANSLAEDTRDLCTMIRIPIRRLNNHQSLLWSCIYASELPWQ